LILDSQRVGIKCLYSPKCFPEPAPLGCASELMNLQIFGFGLLQDGNVGVVPECEEILIRGACFGGVALHRVGAAEAGERADTIN
jgi:hypothetical protein